jgi:hypothetical protein
MTTTPAVPEREDAIRALVTRLSRPHRSGGDEIERAAILAEGADSKAIITWILAHGGEPEETVAVATRGGLWGSRGAPEQRPPRRYVLPTGALRAGS